MEIKEIQEIIKAENIDTIRIEYPDLYGICRNKMVPARRLQELAEEGINFAQAIYAIDLTNDVAPGTGCGYEIEWKDMTIMPDLSTFTVLPYLEGTARLIGNAFRDGEPYLSFAVQGGDTQDQNLLQFFLNVVEFGMNVQQAAEAANITSYQMQSSFGAHTSEPGRLVVRDDVPAWPGRCSPCSCCCRDRAPPTSSSRH